MRKYKCHKIVDAAQITRIVARPIYQHGYATNMVENYAVTLDDGEYIVVRPSVFARGEPEEGDYLVRDQPYGLEAGTIMAWVPKEVFEAGYAISETDKVPARENADGTVTLLRHGDDMGDYHPAITHVLNFFAYAHLPERLQEISKDFHDLAHKTADRSPSNQETTIALRKLLEAKDAAVRAAL